MHQTGCTHRSSETAAVWRNTFTSLGTQMRHAACRNAATVSRKHAASSFRTVRLSITYVFSAFACVFCIHVLFFCFRTFMYLHVFSVFTFSLYSHVFSVFTFSYSRFLCIRTFFLYSHAFMYSCFLCIHVFFSVRTFSLYSLFMYSHVFSIQGGFFKYSHLFCIHVFSVFTFSLYSSF